MPRRSSPFRRPTPSAWVLLTGTLFVGALSGVTAIRPQRAAVAMPTPAGLGARFDTVVAPFLKTYCLECHSGDKPEAELDLSTLTSMTAAVDEPRWGLILEMLESGEMPADDARTQPTAPRARPRPSRGSRTCAPTRSRATPATPAWCWPGA